jgi:hypothetical protein
MEHKRAVNAILSNVNGLIIKLKINRFGFIHDLFIFGSFLYAFYLKEMFMDTSKFESSASLAYNSIEIPD